MPAHLGKTVSPRQLKAMLHDGDELALLDVREAGQFGESHLLFATPLPYSRLELDATSLVPRKSARVVVCDDGALGVAPRAAARLEALGYTDVAVLQGGTAGWSAAGETLFKGVNVPSKLFGELVEHAFHTPRVTAQELVRMREAGEDFVLLDGRPLNEHRRMTIPGSTCCPNAELPYRVSSIVRSPATKIVVNCAGRTRSILGAQTLINFGVPNPVYALENGTQGWRLSGLELEHGSTRKYPDRLDPAALPAARAQALRLMQRFEVRTVGKSEAESWLEDATRTTYFCDVRTPEEFSAGSLPGAVHAPGGQLIQATDQWMAVRNARVIVVDGGECVRAPVVASWLKQLGWDARVLEDGVRSALAGKPAPRPELPTLPTISASELSRALDSGACTVIDLGPSMDFRKAHIPGSRWSTRVRLAAELRAQRLPVVLAGETEIARLAATELPGDVIRKSSLLAGGVAAWRQAGHPVETTPGTPGDADCIDYLFFVHDRHAGNPAAMREYLAWETGLLGQLDAQDRAAFRIPAS